ncbi:MAG: ATP-binding protein [Thermoplasmata archaeon]
MNFEFRYNKDFLVFVGNNDSGKTTLCMNFIRNIPRKELFVINSGAAPQWEKFGLPPDHVFVPKLYDEQTLNQLLAKVILAPNVTSAHIVIDDADNFKLKSSDILKSVFINSRRLNLGGTIIVRRLSWVPIEIYDYSKYVFFARQNVDFSIYYISELMPRNVAEMLRTLPKYVFLVYEPSTGNYTKIKLNL